VGRWRWERGGASVYLRRFARFGAAGNTRGGTLGFFFIMGLVGSNPIFHSGRWDCWGAQENKPAKMSRQVVPGPGWRHAVPREGGAGFRAGHAGV
jgi:hypothetical protein